MYSDKVRELINNLPNRGTLPQATHCSKVENIVCGDTTHLYLRVENDVVRDCHFQTYGCPGAIAAGAAITLLCKEKSRAQCLELTAQSILEYLEGLPPHKVHGAEMAVEALKKALSSVY